MDVSRRDRDRVLHVGPRGNIRVTKFSSEEDQDLSSITRPYEQMDPPRPLLKSHVFYNNSNSNSGSGSSRRFRGEHPYLMRSPVPDDDTNISPSNIPSHRERRYSMESPVRDDDPQVPPNNIPSLLPSEANGSSGPRPLFSDDVIQKLRESLKKTAARHENLRSVEWDEYDENTYSPPAEPERMTYEEYLEEEEKTKQTIDEIIMVAQALRDKIQREEERRRATAALAFAESSNSNRPLLGSVPQMANPQPKIPSLLDLHVEPPEEILIASNRYEPEYPPDYQDVEVCWNCDKRGHRYINCKYPRLRNFCYRCGERGYDLLSCPICNV